jgi:hypothetical protein
MKCPTCETDYDDSKQSNRCPHEDFLSPLRMGPVGYGHYFTLDKDGYLEPLDPDTEKPE